MERMHRDDLRALMAAIICSTDYNIKISDSIRWTDEIIGGIDQTSKETSDTIDICHAEAKRRIIELEDDAL